MTERVVELIRRFEPMSSNSWALDFLVTGSGRPQRWHEIQGEHRVLIIADPGAGKTFEAKLRAEKMRDRGENAFFIRIERIDLDFNQAFEIGNANEFAGWLGSTEEAWFFLDSVDEAQLETPRALEAAVRIFGARIYGALQRSHIFITSREDAWRALPDQTLIEQHLPYRDPEAAEDKARSNGEGNPEFKSFRLTGLTENEIAVFADRYGVGDCSKFLEAVKRGNLLAMAERPFDLKALIGVWIADHHLGSRFDVLQRMIGLQLGPLSGMRAPARVDAVKARAGARTLAAAVMLTGKSVICLPDGVHSPDRLDPRVVLPRWTTDEIAALLRTGIFDDIVYTSVRFRHREIRELLSAEWANELLSQQDRRIEVEHIFFRNSYGEDVIVPRMRPVLTWLILLDDEVRDKALAIAPEIASEGGDPSRLPLKVRQKILRDVVERLAERREG